MVPLPGILPPEIPRCREGLLKMEQLDEMLLLLIGVPRPIVSGWRLLPDAADVRALLDWDTYAVQAEAAGGVRDVLLDCLAASPDRSEVLSSVTKETLMHRAGKLGHHRAEGFFSELPHDYVATETFEYCRYGARCGNAVSLEISRSLRDRYGSRRGGPSHEPRTTERVLVSLSAGTEPWPRRGIAVFEIVDGGTPRISGDRWAMDLLREPLLAILELLIEGRPVADVAGWIGLPTACLSC